MKNQGEKSINKKGIKNWKKYLTLFFLMVSCFLFIWCEGNIFNIIKTSKLNPIIERGSSKAADIIISEEDLAVGTVRICRTTI